MLYLTSVILYLFSVAVVINIIVGYVSGSIWSIQRIGYIEKDEIA